MSPIIDSSLNWANVLAGGSALNCDKVLAEGSVLAWSSVLVWDSVTVWVLVEVVVRVSGEVRVGLTLLET